MTQPSRRSNRFSLRSKQLGQLLVEAGQIQQDQIDQALATQETSGGMLGQVLREIGACDEIAIAGALLKQVQVTDVNCDELTVPPELVQAIPLDTCIAKRLCPFEKLGNLLCIAMANPLDRPAINAVEEVAHLKVKPFKATWPKIKEMIDRSYTEENLSAAVGGEAGGLTLEEPQLENVELEEVPTLQLQDESMPVPELIEEPAMAEEIQEAAPADADVHGLDTLDAQDAEVIETDARGLTRRKKSEVPEQPPPPVKKPKVAKINVDLDAFDASSPSETVQGDEPDGMEEISEHSTSPAPVAASVTATAKPVKLEVITDAYFYQDGHEPEEGHDRTVDLINLIQKIPLAEAVADSEAAYLKPKVTAIRPAAVGKATAIPEAPADPITVIPISEAEFKKLTVGLDIDPVGEWNWKFAAAGPVQVVDYEVESV